MGGEDTKTKTNRRKSCFGSVWPVGIFVIYFPVGEIYNVSGKASPVTTDIEQALRHLIGSGIAW